MRENVRTMPSADARSRRVVRARRHAEGGGAVVALQVRPDGLLALLAAGAGRGTVLLDREASDRLVAAVGALRGDTLPAVAAEDAREHPAQQPDPGTWTPGHVPGRLRVATSGRGPMRVGGRVVVPVDAHRLFCGFAATGDRLDVAERVMPCHGCGLGVLVDAAPGGAA